jgi:hypothetical protein
LKDIVDSGRYPRIHSTGIDGEGDTRLRFTHHDHRSLADTAQVC